MCKSLRSSILHTHTHATHCCASSSLLYTPKHTLAEVEEALVPPSPSTRWVWERTTNMLSLPGWEDTQVNRPMTKGMICLGLLEVM